MTCERRQNQQKIDGQLQSSGKINGKTPSEIEC